MTAFRSQGGLSPRTSAAGLQVSTQTPQNVHSPAEKSTTGKPPDPTMRIFSGQTAVQSSHRVQTSTKRASSIA